MMEKSRSSRKKFKVFLTAIKRITDEKLRVREEEVEIRGVISVENEEQAKTLEYLKKKMASGESVYLNFNLEEIDKEVEIDEKLIEEKARKMADIIISFHTPGSTTNWLADPVERCKDFLRKFALELRQRNK